MLFALLLSVVVNAQSRSREALAVVQDGRKVSASLKDGFHFNEKAPNSIRLQDVKIKPTSIKPLSIEFETPDSSWANSELSLYVCDDAITFCEMHKIALGEKTKQLKGTVSKKNKSKYSHGFLENDFVGAIDIAKKKNQLLLVDFSARWCPGCVRFETETFGTKHFSDLTKSFVKVKLDTDIFENQVLAEKFNIKAIPTLLVINSSNEEIGRVIDYQPDEKLGEFFSSISQNPTPIADFIKSGDSKSDEKQIELGKRLILSGRFKDAVRVLSKSNSLIELRAAKVGYAEARLKNGEITKTDFVNEIRALVAEESGSTRSIVWRQLIVENLEDKSQKQSIANEGVKLANDLLADPKRLIESSKGDLVGEFEGIEPLLVAMYRTDLLEASGSDKSKELESAKDAAVIGQGLKIKTSDRGPSLRLLIVLTNAQLYSEADKLARDLLLKDSSNGDLQRRRLKVLLALKKYDESIRLGKSALKNSYGRNEFWVVENLTRAYIGKSQKSEAKNLLKRYLTRSELEWPNMKSTKQTLQELAAQVN